MTIVRFQADADLRQAIAQQLLSTLDDSTISQATGLSREEVQAIRSDVSSGSDRL